MTLLLLVTEPPPEPITVAEVREVESWYDSRLDAEAIERLRPSPFTRAIYRIREWRAKP